MTFIDAIKFYIGMYCFSDLFLIRKQLNWWRFPAKPLQIRRRFSSAALPSRNTTVYTSSFSSYLIETFTRCCYQRDLSAAMRAMEAMERHGVWADSVTYSELVKCCLARRALEEGKLVHRHVFSGGYEPKTFLVNVLMSMYVKFGVFEEAYKLFEEMPERNVVSWTTIVAGYSSAGLSDRALELFVLMLREGVKPNMFTYSSVLRSCDVLWNVRRLHSGTVKVGLESDVFVRSSLIDVYSRLGDMRSAVGVFNDMPTGDLVVWNSIIGGFAQNSEGNEALSLFKDMKRAGFQAEQSTLTSVLRACTGLSLLELGRQVHVHVLKYNQDLILNNALLDMYCKSGSFEDAKTLFTMMAEKDVISWSTMIAGSAQNGFSLEALKLFDTMKASGHKPNHITFLGILFACSHAGLVEEGWHHFRSMKQLYGIDPGKEHYGCVIDLLGRAGKLDEAMRLIHECQPDAITWRTLLGACRVHRNVDLAIYAAKQVLKLDPDDAGTYILLSNICANSQRWTNVAEIRQAMRTRGIKKEPGCSWIEVNKQIHAFVMGDNSHPQMKEIDKNLSELVQRLMVAGYIPDTSFVLQDLEDEQREDSLQRHSEKLAIAFGLMNSPKYKTIRIRKNIRICGDCHVFSKLVTKVAGRRIVIRDPIRYHHFQDGVCSCGDYW